MKHILFSIFILSGFISNAQVGIGTNIPNASAALEIKDSLKGFLPPRMKTMEREAIINPAEGLVVYDKDRKALFLFNGTQWNMLQTADALSVNSFSNYQYTVPPDIIPESEFYADKLGISVAISGSFAFIGAEGFNSRTGYVLVYKRTGDEWKFFQAITPNVAVNGMKFGSVIKAKDNYLFISAPNDMNASAVMSGAVYVYFFNGTGWTLQTKLTPSSGVANGEFGKLTDANANADQLVVYGKGNSLVNVFKRTGNIWGVPQFFTLDDVADVAIHPNGDALAFGVITPSELINLTTYNNPGHVAFYLKTGANYTFSTNIINPSPVNEDRFGTKILFANNYDPFYYILLAGSNKQLNIGNISISNPAIYDFSGNYTTVFDGNNGFGKWISKTDPYIDNFYSSGLGEYFFAGDNEKIGIYGYGGSAPWFSEKGASINLPETVSLINFGTKYSMDTWASSASGFSTSPCYIVIGTPYANNGKGGFYFLKFQ